MKNNKTAEAVLAGILALATTTAVAHATVGKTPPGMEKCFGIVKAGMNDCPTHTSACTGTSTKDGQLDAYVLLPKGTCKKIVGGNLKSS